MYGDPVVTNRKIAKIDTSKDLNGHVMKLTESNILKSLISLTKRMARSNFATYYPSIWKMRPCQEIIISEGASRRLSGALFLVYRTHHDLINFLRLNRRVTPIKVSASFDLDIVVAHNAISFAI